jgi:serine/threonine-protein kinase
VVDFGISKMHDGVGGGLTGSAALLGTPMYMAPEQFMSSRHVDPRSDQYALGVILYECTVGHNPFPSDSLNNLFTAITQGTFTPPRAVRPELPPAFEAIVLRAMARDPAWRYASVKDFAAALQEFADPYTRATWERVFGPGAAPMLPLPDPERSSQATLATGQSSGTLESVTRGSLSRSNAAARPSRIVVLVAVLGGAVALLLAITGGALLLRRSGSPATPTAAAAPVAASTPPSEAVRTPAPQPVAPPPSPGVTATPTPPSAVGAAEVPGRVVAAPVRRGPRPRNNDLPLPSQAGAEHAPRRAPSQRSTGTNGIAVVE